MNLLRERLTEIMDRERANRNSIHLYCTGPYWVAFERSAYQLHRAFPDSETTPLRLFAYPFPIVMVSVTDRSLRSYTRKLKADVFIDDRNLGGLPDWGTIYEMVTKGLSYEDLTHKYESEYEPEKPKGFLSRLFR